MNLWFVLLYQPLVNALIAFYTLLGGNLAWAIISLTLAIRLLMIPLTTPSLKTAQKMKELAQELEKLKKQYKNDKTAFAQAQLKLYQKHGANPLSGCLPQIIQLIVLIALFQAFNQVLKPAPDFITKLNEVLYQPLQLTRDHIINTHFLYLDLTKPDLLTLPFKIGIGPLSTNKIPGFFLLASALVQFYSSKMMMPTVSAEKKIAKKTPEQADDMAAAMQSQMLYLMPAMTIFIGFTFPSGLVLYWFAFSLFMLVQQQMMLGNSQRPK
jgi:YidC/Oxa1 family membrane protein insertase